MDGYLRNALVYSVFPIVITLAGALLVAFKSLPASVANSARRFASGAAFAVIAIELLPDVLRAHSTAGITGFGIGLITMIAAKWLPRIRERAGRESDHCLPRRLIGAGAGVPIAGLLIGGGFVAGVREGQLLTLVT
jgi:zinc transporter, ZIP family